MELTCLLYLLAEKSKDRVRVVLFSEEIMILPPTSGNEGLTLFISTLEKKNIINGDGKVNLEYERTSSVEESKKLALLKSFVARNKEVVLFSDFSELKNINELNKLTYRKNMHTFKMLSPVDIKTKKAFSIFSHKNGRSQIMTAREGEQKDLKGKIKVLNVKDRFLEGFVREML